MFSTYNLFSVREVSTRATPRSSQIRCHLPSMAEGAYFSLMEGRNIPRRRRAGLPGRPHAQGGVARLDGVVLELALDAGHSDFELFRANESARGKRDVARVDAVDRAGRIGEDTAAVGIVNLDPTVIGASDRRVPGWVVGLGAQDPLHAARRDADAPQQVHRQL